MDDTVLLSEDHWPLLERPGNVLEYFVDVVCAGQKPKYFKTKYDLISAMTADKEFRKFFEQTPVSRLNGVTHLHQLIHDDHFDEQGLVVDYMRYCQYKEFEGLSEEKRQEIDSGFCALRKESYQAALEGEARRLGCSTAEVRPLVQIMPLASDEGQSKLMDLPEEMFVRILASLETLDVFKFTLVCKKWKNLVDKYRSEFRKAEYRITTHLTTFTQWMEASWSTSTDQFISNYLTFSWGLINWCCDIAINLETLVVNASVKPLELANLLEKCPKLLHLQIIIYEINPNEVPRPELTGLMMDKKLPKLTSLVASNGVRSPYWELIYTLLKKTVNPEVYQGLWYSIGSKQLITCFLGLEIKFENLTALHLTHYTPYIIQSISKLPSLKLRYLRIDRGGRDLGFFGYKGPINEYDFSQLLSKLNYLEVLVMLAYPGFSDETVRLVTKLKLNLKFVVLRETIFTPEDHAVRVNTQSRVRTSTLINFRQMLLEKNPTMNLEDFSFILRDKEHLSALEKANTGFNLLEERSTSAIRLENQFGLNDPVMRRRLGLKF